MQKAILIPCYNEGQAIYDVVMSFKLALPDALIYVYDNNSSDNTYQRLFEPALLSDQRKIKARVML